MKTLATFLVLTLVLSACGTSTPTTPQSFPPPDQTQGGSGAPVDGFSQPEENPAIVAPASGSAPTDVVPPTPTVSAHASIDIHNLPIGDGKVSTSPQVGYVFSCQTQFNGGGAFTAGDWIHSDGTYDPFAKPTVDGSVTWPSSFTITLQGNTRVVASNDLPDHPTGNFPVSPSDDAYRYDRNPNSIQSQTVGWNLPANPTVAAAPTCVSMGPIGIMLTGTVLFNALDAAGRDAVAHEIQDDCNGHPQQNGMYHYHNLTSCIDDPGTGHSALLGYALDGFGIYGPRGENGETLTDADLDACHGHTHLIGWDGRMVMMYHYHTTVEYPYTIGCFMGTPVQSGMQMGPGGGQGGGRTPAGGPPVGAPPPPGPKL